MRGWSEEADHSGGGLRQGAAPRCVGRSALESRTGRAACLVSKLVVACILVGGQAAAGCRASEGDADIESGSDRSSLGVGEGPLGEAEPTAVGRPISAPPAAGEPTWAGPPAPAAPIELAVSPVDLSEAPDLAEAELRPGPWSPDGLTFVVWRVTRRGELGVPVGRVGTFDALPAAGVATATAAARTGAGAGSSDTDDDGRGTQRPIPPVPPVPLWESGDIEAEMPGEGAAVWMRDGTLALARSDNMFVGRDGVPVETGAAPSGDIGQIMRLLSSPNARRILAIGPRGAWIVSDDRTVIPISGAERAGLRAWDWRTDSAALAAVAAADDGRLEYFVIDVATGEPEKVGEVDPLVPGRPPPRPRWLANGLLFMTAAGRPPPGRSGVVHRIANPTDSSATDLHALLGLEPSAAAQEDAAGWASPDGRWLLYPEVIEVPGEGRVAQRATWLYDVPGERALEMEPAGNPVWSPDGRRFAWIEAGAVRVGTVDPPTTSILPRDVGARVPDGAWLSWSPDARYLLYLDVENDIWIVRSDGTDGPSRVGRTAGGAPVSWSPAGDRFAAALAPGDDGRGGGLVLVVAVSAGGR